MTAEKRQSHRQRKFRKKIIRNLILLFIVVVLLAIFGIKILINLSIFVADFAKETPQGVTGSQDEGGLLLTPKIFDLPSATHSAQIEISGSTTKGKTTVILVNNSVEKELVSDSDTFDARISLDPGTNIVMIRVEDTKANRSKESVQYQVIYVQEKPTLTIETPTDGQTFDRDDTVLRGTAGPDMRVKVNGAPVVVGTDGSFTYDLRLKEGENFVTVTGENVAGSTVTVDLTVRYERDE